MGSYKHRRWRGRLARAACAAPLILALVLGGCQAHTAAASRPLPYPTNSQRGLPPAGDRDPAPVSAATHSPTPRSTFTQPPAATATATDTPTPLAAPLPEAVLPERAQVAHIFGYGQLLALSCESRSAADWARHFGITIHELEFFAKLPKSSNPETGFVGSVNGGWGNLPPEGYGVHAGPVAQVLRDYGAQAQAVRGISFTRLQGEIAAGRPVIVWVTGHVEPGKGVDIRVDGQTVRVARYEHTVIVTGYDAQFVTFLDGKTVYQRPIATFLKAWAPLENMAVIWDIGLERSGGPRE